MASSSRDQEPGGFLQPTLPSPPASSVNSPSAARFVLPQPRSRPLRSGSSKESDFVSHVEQKLLAISRRYENRFSATLSEEVNPDVAGRGYKDIGEEIRDLDPVVDLVWISGTPSLQITFLLTIALTMMTSLPSFPFMPRPTFQLLHKLDLMFASLLKGVSAESGEPLPGSETGRSKLSTTEKVRMRGIVERTRISVVEVAGKDGSLADVSIVAQSIMTDTEDDFNMTTDNDDDMDALEDEGSHRRWEMDIARVYERTIMELGMALDTSARHRKTKYTFHGLALCNVPADGRSSTKLENIILLIETLYGGGHRHTAFIHPPIKKAFAATPSIEILATSPDITMPSYQTGGVNIRLAVADFNKTVTPNPRTQQNKESIANADRALEQFTDGSTTIAETPLLDESGCSLGFLGQHRDMPFFVSHAKPPDPDKGKETRLSSRAVSQDGSSQDSSLTELSSPGASPFHNPSKINGQPSPLKLPPTSYPGSYQDTKNLTPPGAQALCLRIQPTRKPILCPSETRRIKWGHHDMKIDIFLNGDLCSSSYIPETAFHKKDGVRDIYSGVRVGWVTEKPWVLLPSTSKVSDFANRSPGAASRSSGDVKNRWENISNALRSTANSYAPSEGNELPPTNDCLSSLANYKMPATLPEMLETGNRQYAIIDVVIVAGRGRKEHASAPYLMNPMPLKLEGSRDPSPTRPKPENNALEPRKRGRIAHPTRSAADSEILSQGFSLEYRRRSSASTVTPVPTPVPAIQPKRNRMIYHDVIDTRQTWEEELRGIIDQAASDAKRLITRSKPADPLDGPDLPAHISTASTIAGSTSEGSGTPQIPSPSKIVTLKYTSPSRRLPALAAPASPTPAPTIMKKPPRKRKHTTSSSSSPDQPLSQLRPKSSFTPLQPHLKPLTVPSIPLFPAQTPTPTLPTLPLSSSSGPAKPYPRNAKRTKAVYQQAKPFAIPPLSRNSVVSYSEGGVVRQVRSERGGCFREEGVLVGVRFVVG
ncbi:MAG: hypothetical protein Q9169_006812 [Polycauliona sp. 2 TL-2023]